MSIYRILTISDIVHLVNGETFTQKGWFRKEANIRKPNKRRNNSICCLSFKLTLLNAL
jgi:hypothetical protein